ncbi:MAG: gliding motility-associated C-terminal domain-containing protein [Prevotella sp.]|nr:gliding motility-associated C-terminal domain-containing protein [Prevotella sp.]
MKKKAIFLLFAASIWSSTTFSQQVNPLAYYTDEDGLDQESTSIDDGQAPLSVTFRANPSEMDGYTPSYEWHFRLLKDGEGQRELFVRYEEDTQYTFNESGTYSIVLKTRLEQDGAELDSVAISISIAESRLEFPNAFSPNGDGINDIYKAKDQGQDAWRSIVKFKAIIINRWGQKLYEWNDPAGGWDGTHNGHPVKEGVYFVQVSAKGADGRDYNIRKDVNLIRGYSEGGNTSGEN